jgi:hypothetical protein
MKTFIALSILVLTLPLSFAQDLDISTLLPEKVTTDTRSELVVSGTLPIRSWVDGIGGTMALKIGSEGVIFLDQLGAGYEVSLSREAYSSRYSGSDSQTNVPGAIVANAKIKAGYAIYNKNGVLVGVLGTLGGDIYHVDRETGIAGSFEAGAELMILSSIVNGKLVAINLLPTANAFEIQSDLIFAVDGNIDFIDNIRLVADFYYGFESAIKRFSMQVTFEKQIPNTPVTGFVGLGFNVASDQHNGKVRPSLTLGVRIALGGKKKDKEEEEDEVITDDDFDDDFYDNFPEDEWGDEEEW